MLDLEKLVNKKVKTIKIDGIEVQNRASRVEKIVKPTNEFYVSVADFECMREAYYSVSIPKPYPEETLRAFEIGNSIHEAIEKSILNEFENSTHEQRIEKEYDVHGKKIKFRGKIDIVLDDQTPIEIKSTNAKKRLYGPFEHHIGQLQMYMDMLDASKGYLLYVHKIQRDKNTLYLVPQQFVCDKDNNKVNKILNKNFVLSIHLENGIIPQRNRCWMCLRQKKYCRYYDECRTEVN